jgi:hypothetical protein
VAVVGVEDKLKGQMPMAFAVVKDAARVATPELVKALEKACSRRTAFSGHRPPGRVHFVTGTPKTRSGKMLRRSLQALAEGRDPGDLTTIDDPSTSSRSERTGQLSFAARVTEDPPMKVGGSFYWRTVRIRLHGGW